MVARNEYDQVLRTISSWPAEQRLSLANEVLESMRHGTSTAGPQRQTVDRALGIGRGDGPAPDDQTVKRWLEEHRQERFGG